MKQKEFRNIIAKKGQVIASLDFTKIDEILALSEQIADYVCAIKIHAEIIEDFSIEKINTLRKLAQEKNFAIIQDSKFCDIGNTVRLQFEKGQLQISTWADIVTAHAISGPHLITELSSIDENIGILLIAQMSTENNLITTDYTKRTIEFAKSNKNVIGFISQRKISHKFLHITPGVTTCSDRMGFSFSNRTDEKGQNYVTPREALDRGVDAIIIGRGIYQNANPIDVTRETSRFCKLYKGTAINNINVLKMLMYGCEPTINKTVSDKINEYEESWGVKIPKELKTVVSWQSFDTFFFKKFFINGIFIVPTSIVWTEEEQAWSLVRETYCMDYLMKIIEDKHTGCYYYASWIEGGDRCELFVSDRDLTNVEYITDDMIDYLSNSLSGYLVENFNFLFD